MNWLQGLDLHLACMYVCLPYMATAAGFRALLSPLADIMGSLGRYSSCLSFLSGRATSTHHLSCFRSDIAGDTCTRMPQTIIDSEACSTCPYLQWLSEAGDD